MVRPIRIAISGAGGQLGYALIFRIGAGGLFGPDQPVSLSLLETPEAQPIIEAHRMELKDCAFPVIAGIDIGSDDHRAFEGADWVILLGGRPRTRGVQTRGELLRDNGPIYAAHGIAINDAAPMARVLVVANPCNTNCLIAMSRAQNVPAHHWFAMNQLDRMRAGA